VRPVKLTQVGVGNTSWVRLDRRAETLNTLIVTRLISGTAMWSLQTQENDPPGSTTPFVDANISAVTANAFTVWEGFVWAYCRLAVTVGTGTVQLTVLQGGP
jgi:hypothetical protein